MCKVCSVAERLNHQAVARSVQSSSVNQFFSLNHGFDINLTTDKLILTAFWNNFIIQNVDGVAKWWKEGRKAKRVI